MDRTELITIGEAARRLSICRQSVSRRVAKGDLPAFRDVRDARAVFVRVDDVDALRTPRRIEPQSISEGRVAIA